MSTMSIEVVLRLIDQLTAPLRTAQGELNTLGKSTASAGASTGKLVAPWDAEAKAINQANAALIRHQAKLGISAKLSQPWNAGFAGIEKADAALATLNSELVNTESRSARVAGEWAAVATRITEASAALGKFNSASGQAQPQPGQGKGGVPSPSRGGHTIGGGLVGGMLGLEGLHAGRQLVHGTIHAGAEAAHQEVNMRAAMSDYDVAQIKAKAFELSIGAYKNFSITTIEEAIQDARGVVGSTEEASHLAQNFLGLKTVAQANGGEGGSSLVFAQMVKTLELAGVTQDKARMEEMMDTMAKASAVFPKSLPPNAYFEFFKHAGAYGRTLSPDFIRGVLPSLMAEQGGDSTGQSLVTFLQTFTGKKMKKVAATEFEKLGLLDGDGHIKGREEALSNPYEWLNKYLKPKLDAMHASKEQMMMIVGQLYGDRYAAAIVNLMLTQRSVIEKDKKQMDEAKGYKEQTALRQGQDPFTAMESVKAQFENFLRSAASPLVGPAVTGMNLLAEGISKLTKATSNITGAPTALTGAAALGLGWGGWKLVSGTLGALGRMWGAGTAGGAAGGAAVAGGETAAAAVVGGGILAAIGGFIARSAPLTAAGYVVAHEAMKSGQEQVLSFKLVEANKKLAILQENMNREVSPNPLGDGMVTTPRGHELEGRVAALSQEIERLKGELAAAAGAKSAPDKPGPAAPETKNVNVTSNATASVVIHADVSALSGIITNYIKSQVQGSAERGMKAGTAALSDGTELAGGTDAAGVGTIPV